VPDLNKDFAFGWCVHGFFGAAPVGGLAVAAGARGREASLNWWLIVVLTGVLCMVVNA
tara:strand:- start:1603 stop:1776 length:174 start_codon:yes stop_codon:yes gene_type:complete